jgi:hypothetical protein
MIWFITTLENPVNQKFGNGLGLYFGKIEDTSKFFPFIPDLPVGILRPFYKKGVRLNNLTP